MTMVRPPHSRRRRDQPLLIRYMGEEESALVWAARYQRRLQQAMGDYVSWIIQCWYRVMFWPLNISTRFFLCTFAPAWKMFLTGRMLTPGENEACFPEDEHVTLALAFILWLQTKAIVSDSMNTGNCLWCQHDRWESTICWFHLWVGSFVRSAEAPWTHLQGR